MVHWDNNKNKAIHLNQIIIGFLLSKLDIVMRNARWIYDWMTLFCMVTPKKYFPILTCKQSTKRLPWSFSNMTERNLIFALYFSHRKLYRKKYIYKMLSVNVFPRLFLYFELHKNKHLPQEIDISCIICSLTFS